MWSAFALCLYIAIMPTTSELLYWMAGGITYTVGYSLLLVVLGLFIRLSFAGLSIYSFALYSVLSFALVFLIAGTNEVTALIQLMLFLLGAVAAFVKVNRSKYIWLAAVMIALVGLFIVAAAPGNANRMSALGGAGGVKWLAPFYSLFSGLITIIKSWLIMYVLSTMPFIAPITQRLSEALYLKVKDLKYEVRIFLLLAILGLFVAALFPNYWVQGVAPPNRTKTIVYVLALITWLPTLSLLKTLLPISDKSILWASNHKRAAYLFYTVVISVIVVTMNLGNIFIDNVWRAKNYHQQLSERYELIQDSLGRGQKNVGVSPLHDIPKSIFFDDITADPANWKNGCYSRHFGLASIKIVSQ